MRLEKWALVPTVHGSYCLYGEVAGSPLYRDDEFIHTSKVVGAWVKGRKVKTYSGSVYELGTPDPAWARENPGKVQQLFSGSLGIPLMD